MTDIVCNCPICSSALTPIQVAPCFDCGHAQRELEDWAHGKHEYRVYRIWGQDIVLCDFCDADFGSYFPDYWGLPEGPLPDYPLDLVSIVENPQLSQDGYCNQCQHRLAFLRFRQQAIDHNSA
ncbi:hypothetical protein ACFFGH_32605 [Lysobacter korlensis]|uniref:Uncharacterized protein n=1 Tax=Lysobacter korlensis TaxID=553636 RepID=A0ABV6S045_9GAMM